MKTKNDHIGIYMDLDSVMFDFDKAALVKFGINTAEINKSNALLTPEQKQIKKRLYASIVTAGKSFWENLEMMHDAQELWDFTVQNFNNIAILTAYIASPNGKADCIEGKKKSVETNLKFHTNERSFICCRSVEKQNYVDHLGTEKSILIDDRERNIQQWIDAGGIGILHTNTIDTLAELKEYMA